MSNKTRILEAALKLFNAQGSMNVSTNHIAAEAGISPGNLYYHFQNKEEIILALFRKMIPEWDSDVVDISSGEGGLAHVENLLGTLYKVIWNYRFIHRELSPLLQTYPSVKKLCVPILRQRLQEILTLIQTLHHEGILRTGEIERQKSLANTMLLIPLFWLNYLDAIGETPNKKNIDKGIDMMRGIIALHMTNPS
jgi:AcrR family transcriptional regulator